MELRQYASILRKWLWLILLGGFLAATSALVVSLLSTPIYQSSTTLLISQGSDPNNLYTGLLTSNSIAPTYVEQIKSPVVLERVIRDLNLPMTATELKAGMTVQQVRNTQLIQITVEDPSPERAQAIVAGTAKAFIDFNLETQDARYAGAQRDLDQQIADVRKKIDDTQKALAPLMSATDPRSLSSPEYVRTEQARLQMELTTGQAQYSALLQSAQAFRLSAARYADSVTVSSPSDLPRSPVRPNTRLNTLLGLVVGLMLGVGVAFLIEYLDDTLKSPEDVTRVLQMSTLGMVARFPKELNTGRALVTVASPRSPSAEAYRNLRTNVQFAMMNRTAVAAVVTSAGPGEGKTTTLANLGVAMAQMGKRVILVDSDLRRPTLNQVFGLPQEPGLTDYFLGEVALESLVHETAVPNLYLIPSGRIPPNPAELIASDRMNQLIETLKKQFDVTLYDSPPIMPVTDAALLAAQTGHLLWVIAAGETRTDVVRRVEEALSHVDTKVLGVILNRGSAAQGYGYYYYYYSQDGKKKQKAREDSFKDRAQLPVEKEGARGKPADAEAQPESLGKIG